MELQAFRLGIARPRRWLFDEFDYDSTQVPVLVDLEWRGRPPKTMLWANRDGFWYVLDRATGEFLFGKPFPKVTWADGIDEKGRPRRVQNPTPEGIVVYPSFVGATNWYSRSYSPRTGLCYVPACRVARPSPILAVRSLKRRRIDEPGRVTPGANSHAG